MERIETEKLILRPWEMEDAPDMFDYARDPRVGPIAGWQPHKDLADSERITAMFAESDEVLAIVLKRTGRVIGSIGLHARGEGGAHTRELGYVLHPAYWGRGITPEAARAVIAYGFEQMNLETIFCGYFDGNGKSRRVIEKCGFTFVESRDVPVPQMSGRRLEHFYKLEKADWQENA